MNKATQGYDFQAVLFDLDGTLLDVDMTEFIPRYVTALARYCPAQISADSFGHNMIRAIRQLINQPGNPQQTNEQRLHQILQRELGLTAAQLQHCYEQFQQHDLESLRPLIRPQTTAQQIIATCKAREIPLVLATNPVFPRFMIDARLRWGGIDSEAFSLITTYENSCYCKPQLDYFHAVARQLELAPHNCLMVGNDSSHDLAATAAGMTAFLVDSWLVERNDGLKWPCPHRGDLSSLQNFLAEHVC